MATTVFLSQVWGPVLLAIGLGFFTSPKYYAQLYRNLEKETLAVLLFAMVYIAVGIMHINMHNVWGNFTQGLVSVLGWGLLIKGALFAIFPTFVDQSGDFVAKARLTPLAGAFTLIIGVYLTWISYFV